MGVDASNLIIQLGNKGIKSGNEIKLAIYLLSAESYMSHLSLTQICKQCNMSLSTFKRVIDRLVFLEFILLKNDGDDERERQINPGKTFHELLHSFSNHK